MSTCTALCCILITTYRVSFHPSSVLNTRKATLFSPITYPTSDATQHHNGVESSVAHRHEVQGNELLEESPSVRAVANKYSLEFNHVGSSERGGASRGAKDGAMWAAPATGSEQRSAPTFLPWSPPASARSQHDASKVTQNKS